MDEPSAYELVGRLQMQLNSQLNGIDLLQVPAEQARIIEKIKRQMSDIRLDIRDYEFAETREAQISNASEAGRRLGGLRQSILIASEHGVFGSVDVAHISAIIEQIVERLA